MAEIIDIKRKKIREPIPQSIRFNVFRRDNFACRYCGSCSGDGVTLHVDHATSVKDGGKNDENNLVTACSDCNYGKGAKSLTPPRAAIAVGTPAEPTGLVGMWGHTFDETDDICWQFHVIRKISDDIHLCQLFSWLDGDATECVSIETAVLLKSCKLYASNEARANAYQKHCDQMRRRRQEGRGGTNS